MRHRDDEEEWPEEDGFGACLKIMDDNHWLVEWLAYHWFALPLRYLIVMIDPKSRTSPIPILERWSGGDNNRTYMTIEYVNETYEGARAKGLSSILVPGNAEHLGPQRMFLGDCMRRYKRMGWNSWIVATDTDEFVGINPLVRTTTDPGHELYRGDVSIPGNHERGHLMTMLKRELRRRKELKIPVKWPDCIAMNRMQICTNESPANRNASMIPPGFRYEDFLTQRFLLGGEQLRPKDMVHIGGIEAEYFEKLDLLNEKGANTHNVAPGRCAQGAPRHGSLFQVKHYDGTEEQRKFREDPRGKYGKRMGTTPQMAGTVCPKFVADDLQPWLRGFIDAVGPDEARRLLEGNGRVHSWPAYEGTAT